MVLKKEYHFTKDNKEAYSCIKELGDEHQTTFMSQLIKVLFGNLKDERKSYETLLENAVSEGILSKQHIIERYLILLHKNLMLALAARLPRHKLSVMIINHANADIIL